MIRVGIAGIGYIAEEYIKLFTGGKIHHATVTALSSRNESRMQEIKTKYALTEAALFTDYESMLVSGCIDMVMICTPHFYHPKMAIQAISRGIHTMIEKPVGVFPEELDALMDCVRAHPAVQSGVLYCRRANPVFREIKRLLSENAIGQLKRITWIITDMYRPQCYFDVTDWRGTYSGEGGGLLMNQVSHHIDLLVWLCGLPEAMLSRCYTARERDIEVENEVTITMDYPGGAIGQFIASTRECPGSSRLELSGSKGQILLDNERRLTLRTLETDEREFALTTTVPFPTIGYTEEIRDFDAADNPTVQAMIINNFISSLEDHDAVLCPVAEAVKAQQFIQAAYLSSWQEKRLTLPVDAAAYTEALHSRMARKHEV